MARVNFPVTNFTAGEQSPKLDIRIDTKRYQNGAATIRNAIVMPHGGARKRPGTRHVAEVKDSSATPPLLVRFEFNVEQAYHLEFGNNYVRFYKDGGIIVTGDSRTITGITAANPAVVTYTGTDPSNGDQIFITGVGGSLGPYLNGRRFTVANVNAGANTLELSGFSTASLPAWSSGGAFDKPVEVTTTYTSAQLDGMSFTQSSDTLYIAHSSHPIRKLTRTSHTAWTLAEANIEAGPFRALNSDDDHVISVSVTAGTVNISAITKANPGVVTTAAHTFLDGETVKIASVTGMTEVNDKYFIVKNPTSTTLELYALQSGGVVSGDGGGTSAQPVDTTGYTTYVSGGTVTRTSTATGTLAPGTTTTLTATKDTWTADNVGGLYRLWEPGQASGIAAAPIGDDTAPLANNNVYTENGNVYAVANLNTWTDWEFVNSVPAHEKGTIRVTGVAGTGGGYFDAEYLHDSSAVVRITGYNSATSVTAIVETNHIPASVVTFGTSFWEEGAWSDRRGYPSVITFHESRLMAAATSADPQVLWGSKTGAFENFQDGANDNEALVYAIASQSVDVVKWMEPGKVLMMGTPSSEYAVAASSLNEGLTPANLTVKRQTGYGSGIVKPVRVGQALIFGERKSVSDSPSRKLRELVYSFQDDSFVAPDITIAAEHITGEGVEALAYQPSPDNVVWGIRTDGDMAALTYEREQEVIGWHQHGMGGTSPEVERISTLPGTNGTDLWMVVKRTIGGGTKRYIEYMTDGLLEDTAKEDAIYLDSALSYDSTPITSVTGLWHLEGQEVYALLDGYKAGPFTVTNGGITLEESASTIHVGLRYTTIIETNDLEAGAAAGTAKSRKKRITNVFLDLHRSLGGQYGHSSDRMFNILYRVPSDLVGSSPDLKTGLVRCAFPNRWERKAVVRIEHSDPYPFTLLGVVVEMSTTG